MARDGQRLEQPRLRSKVLSSGNRWKPPEAGLIASAARVSGITQQQRMDLQTKMSAEGWQNEAWNWIDMMPEFRYAVAWVGNLLSKAVLTVVKDGETVPLTQSAAWLDQIYGGRSNHGEMLRQLGTHFTVAGEAYLILSADEAGNDEWYVVPAVDVKTTDGETYSIADAIEFKNATVIRMWRPHPRHILKSDAPSRAVLGTLAQAYDAEQHISAQLKSRLTSNGILWIPNEVSIGKSPTSTTDENGDTVLGATNATPDEFIQMLMDTASVAIANPSSPAATIPIVVQVPQDSLEHIQKMDLWGKLDEKVIEMRTDAIHRMALGMDMPPEVLEGTSDLNHWSSWQVEEAAIKAHTEPLLAVIASSLTSGILIPILMDDEKMSVEDASHYSIGMDTSKLRLRPNRSVEALELYDRGELSGDALRRENGFEPDDVMDEDQRRVWFLTQLVKSTSGSPEQLNAALRALGVPITILASDEAANVRTTDTDSTTHNDDGDPNNGARAGTPTLSKHPVQNIPDTQSPSPALVAAGDILVHRALERAGNRLKAKMQRKTPGIPTYRVYENVQTKADELDDLLDGAWDLCPETALRYGGDAEQFASELDRYTRGLLVTGKVHDQFALTAALSVQHAGRLGD